MKPYKAVHNLLRKNGFKKSSEHLWKKDKLAWATPRTEEVSAWRDNLAALQNFLDKRPEQYRPRPVKYTTGPELRRTEKQTPNRPHVASELDGVGVRYEDSNARELTPEEKAQSVAASESAREAEAERQTFNQGRYKLAQELSGIINILADKTHNDLLRSVDDIAQHSDDIAARMFDGIRSSKFKFKPVDVDPWTAEDVANACSLMFENIHADVTKETTVKEVRATIQAMVLEDRRRLQNDHVGILQSTRDNIIEIAFAKDVPAVAEKIIGELGRMSREQTLGWYVRTVQRWQAERNIQGVL